MFIGLVYSRITVGFPLCYVWWQSSYCNPFLKGNGCCISSFEEHTVFTICSLQKFFPLSQSYQLSVEFERCSSKPLKFSKVSSCMLSNARHKTSMLNFNGIPIFLYKEGEIHTFQSQKCYICITEGVSTKFNSMRSQLKQKTGCISKNACSNFISWKDQTQLGLFFLKLFWSAA